MLYTVPFINIDTGADIDTFKTIASLIIPDTNNGHRLRLRKLLVVPSLATPTDKPVLLVIKRILDISAGAAGTADSSITAANMPKADTDSIISIASAGLDYSAEPTAYETNEIFAGGFNDRGGLIERWDRDDPEAPMIGRDQLLGLLAAPRSASAIDLIGHMVFETF